MEQPNGKPRTCEQRVDGVHHNVSALVLVEYGKRNTVSPTHEPSGRELSKTLAVQYVS